MDFVLHSASLSIAVAQWAAKWHVHQLILLLGRAVDEL